MAELQPVRPPRSSLGGHGALAGTIVVIAIIAAMVKPWGWAGGPPLATFPSTPALESPAEERPQAELPSPSGFDLRYRPDLFGGPEPLPGWGLWPAGYLVTFGFAAPVPPNAAPASSPSAGPGRSAGSARPSSTPALSWPVRFDVSEGSHLLVLGINTPLGYRVSQVALQRYAAGDALVPVGIERLPSPWPDHFAVIGVRSR